MFYGQSDSMRPLLRERCAFLWERIIQKMKLIELPLDTLHDSADGKKPRTYGERIRKDYHSIRDAASIPPK